MRFEAGSYDICVVGAGHAGAEAASAAARLGFKTAVFAINLDSVSISFLRKRSGAAVFTAPPDFCYF